MEGFRLFRDYLDAIDLRSAWPFSAESDEAFHGGLLAFEHSLHRPVPVVADPARDTCANGAPSHRVAEEHALHETLDDDPAPNHSRTMPEESISIDTRSPGAG